MILLILRLLFGGVFVYAGAMKAWDPGAFLLDVRSFDLLPDPYATIFALFLPWLEIFAGLAVMTGPLRRGGLFLLNTCLILFLAALTLSWMRGLDIRCGCFGSGGHHGYAELISRDVLLLVLGLFLQARHR